jgi:hypothetical protein
VLGTNAISSANCKASAAGKAGDNQLLLLLLLELLVQLYAWAAGSAVALMSAALFEVVAGSTVARAAACAAATVQ